METLDTNKPTTPAPVAAVACEFVEPDALLRKVGMFRKQGYRLVQIGASATPGNVELTYSFDLNGQLQNLRLVLPDSARRVPSISSIYWCSFLYENEIHDLFNVKVDGMAVDFHGTLYKTAIKFPFGSTKAPIARTSPAATAPSPAAQGAHAGQARPASQSAT
jgi:ech hydrogenase subunit D